jgi:hypothetical protein
MNRHRLALDPETLDWLALTPGQRFAESQKLWATFLALGGSLDPEPDSQSPFFGLEAPSPDAAHGRSSLHSHLVQAKKTQRDKDWPMIRRLVEADYLGCPPRPAARQVAFWLVELRTAEFLVEVCKAYAKKARSLVKRRPLLEHALKQDIKKLDQGLRAEEDAIRAADKDYWKPLRDELFAMRQARRDT